MDPMSKLTKLIQYYALGEEDVTKDKITVSRPSIGLRPHVNQTFIHHHYSSHNPCLYPSYFHYLPPQHIYFNDKTAPAPAPVPISNQEPPKKEEKDQRDWVSGGLAGVMVTSLSYKLGSSFWKYKRIQRDLQFCRRIMDNAHQHPTMFPNQDISPLLAYRLEQALKPFQRNRFWALLNQTMMLTGTGFLTCKFLVPLSVNPVPVGVLVGLIALAELFRWSY